MDPVNEPVAKSSSAFWNILHFSPWTVAITMINTAVFLLAEGNGGTTNTGNLIRFGASERSHIWNGEYWRFVTPMFLHIGWVHFLWNSYMMFGWCSSVEKVLGSRRFLLLYLGTGIGASAVSLLAHDVVAAGASGAGFGVVGATLMLQWNQAGSWKDFWENPHSQRMVANIGFWLFIGFTAVNMDNFAHLGGLAFGLLITTLFLPRFQSRPRLHRSLSVGCCTLLLATTLAASFPWPGQKSLYGGYEAAVHAHRLLETYNETGEIDLNDALDLCDRAESLGYYSDDLSGSRGCILLDLQRHADAEACFDRLINGSNVGDPRHHYNRALAREQLGKTSQAVEDLREALRLQPSHSKAQQMLKDLTESPAPKTTARDPKGTEE